MQLARLHEAQRRSAVVVDVDGDDGGSPFEFSSQLLMLRQGGFAGRTPARPEVDHHWGPAVVGQAKRRAASQRRQREIEGLGARGEWSGPGHAEGRAEGPSPKRMKGEGGRARHVAHRVSRKFIKSSTW